jgi:O-antigen/teichoic acid export membrane protein
MSSAAQFIKDKLLALLRQRFMRQVAILVSGTVLAQGLIMLSSPIVTRLYTPEAMGIVAIFTSIINLVSTLASASYQLAVALPKEDREAVRVQQLPLILTAIVSVLVLIGIAVLVLFHPDNAWMGELGHFVWFVPLGIFLYGASRFLLYWPTRKQTFALAAKSRLVYSIVLVGIQIGLGWLAAGPLGLILGVLFGSLAGLLMLVKLPGNNSATHLLDWRWSELKHVAQRYRRFPIYAAVPTFLESLSLDLPVLLLAWMFDAHVAGLVALSQRVLSVPSTFIANAVEQAFIGEAAARLRTHNASIWRLLLRMIGGMLLVGTPAIIFLDWFGASLFSAVFGAKWAESGVYVQMLAPMYLMQIVASPTGSTLDVLERQDLYVIRVIFRVLLMPGGMLLAWYMHMPAVGAVQVLGITGALTYAVYLAISLIAVRGHKTATANASP